MSKLSSETADQPAIPLTEMVAKLNGDLPDAEEGGPLPLVEWREAARKAEGAAKKKKLYAAFRWFMLTEGPLVKNEQRKLQRLPEIKALLSIIKRDEEIAKRKEEVRERREAALQSNARKLFAAAANGNLELLGAEVANPKSLRAIPCNYFHEARKVCGHDTDSITSENEHPHRAEWIKVRANRRAFAKWLQSHIRGIVSPSKPVLRGAFDVDAWFTSTFERLLSSRGSPPSIEQMWFAAKTLKAEDRPKKTDVIERLKVLRPKHPELAKPGPRGPRKPRN